MIIRSGCDYDAFLERSGLYLGGMSIYPIEYLNEDIRASEEASGCDVCGRVLGMNNMSGVCHRCNEATRNQRSKKRYKNDLEFRELRRAGCREYYLRRKAKRQRPNCHTPIVD